MNTNLQIAKLIENHGYNVKSDEDYLIPDFKENVIIRTRRTIKEYDDRCSSKLDIIVDLPDGKSIWESFGDVGKDKNQALQNNIINFSRNSFHVFLYAFNNLDEDEQVAVESWKFNGLDWKVFIGNFGMKSTSEQPINLPSGLFDEIEKVVRGKKLEGKYHWVRMYYCHNNKMAYASEFLIDNEPDEKAMNMLLQQKWEQKEIYYSVRLFMILKRI